MQRRHFITNASVATLAVVAGTTRATLAQMMSTTGLTGNWAVTSTGDEFHQGTLNLQQSGPTIVGKYTGTPKSGQVSGKLNNNVLSGTWKVANGGESGWLTLWFAENSKGFRGEWGYHGRPPNGQIIGTRS